MKTFNQQQILEGCKDIIEEMGSSSNPFSASHFNSAIIESPEGVKIQVQVTVTTDEDEFTEESN